MFTVPNAQPLAEPTSAFHQEKTPLGSFLAPLKLDLETDRSDKHEFSNLFMSA